MREKPSNCLENQYRKTNSYNEKCAFAGRICQSEDCSLMIQGYGTLDGFRVGTRGFCTGSKEPDSHSTIDRTMSASDMGPTL